MRRVFAVGLPLLLAIFGLLLVISLSQADVSAVTLPEGEAELKTVISDAGTGPTRLLFPPFVPGDEETAVINQPLLPLDEEPKAPDSDDEFDFINQERISELEKSNDPHVAAWYTNQPPRPATNQPVYAARTTTFAASVYPSPHEPIIQPDFSLLNAPASAADANNLTLNPVHRNSDSNSSGFSSTFVFTNTGTNPGVYLLAFYWPNGQYLGEDGPFSLGPGAAYQFDMATAAFDETTFVGYVDIMGDQPLSGTITSPDYGILTGVIYEDDGVTPLTVDVDANVHRASDHYWIGGTYVLNDGSYYVGGLPLNGDYLVHVNAWNGWASQFYSDHVFVDDADAIYVAGTVSGIDFVMQPGGYITGTVYAADGVTPLSNIPVDIDGGWFGTCTDGNGRYTIESLTYGIDYKVVSGGDWNWCQDKPSIYIREYYNGTHDPDLATFISVSSADPTAENIDFALDVGGVIKGRVTDANSGNPLANVHVQASEYDTEWYWGRFNTDASGYYTITGLINADYRVRMDDTNQMPPGYAVQYYPGTFAHHLAERIVVSGAATVNNIDFALHPGGVITGVIVDQDTGLPIPNVHVGADLVGWNGGRGECTDSNGVYTISGLIYGDYWVHAGGWNWCHNLPGPYVEEFYDNAVGTHVATSVSVNSGTPVSDIDFTLETGGYITGHVEDNSGASVANLHVGAIFADSHDWKMGVNTDANGDYVLGPLAAGTYHVEACTDCNDGFLLVREYYNDVYHIQDAEIIAVAKDATTPNIDFVLDPGVWLTGKVTVPPGYSAENIQMDVWQHAPDGFGGGRQTDANGNYTIPVPPIYDSEWGVAARPWGADLGSQWANRFNLSENTNWDFDLDVGGVITGRVMDNGMPVPNVWVNADADEMGQGERTDADGYYTITNLPPADYKVHIDNWDNDRMYVHYGGHDWTWAAVVPVNAGETIGNIDIESPLAGQIEGYVYEMDGVTPIEGVNVIAMNDSGFWYGYTQVDGYYTIDVPVGEHKLLFETDGFWDIIPAYYPDSSIHTWADATPVVVPPLPSSTTINMMVERPAIVSGQITDVDTGAPLGGIHVVVQNVDPAVGREVARWNDCTDELGNYSIDKIWPGDSMVSAIGACGNYGHGVVTGTFTAVPNGNHTVNLTMKAGTAPEAPFTIHTGDSFDYTPFTSGNNLSWDGRDIIPALFAPLVELDDQGQWFSELLAQVPTVSNGDVAIVNDHLIVTYTLKTGLLWSDGAPLTSSDIRFAWEMLSKPHPHYDDYLADVGLITKVDDVATPDGVTAVFTYQRGFFPPSYLGALTYPLPEHILTGQHPIDVRWNSDFAHYPVGNGPYVVKEWLPGSHLDLIANPNYHKRGSGYPIIEEVRFLFTDDPFWAMVNGAADVSLNMGGSLPDDYATYDLNIQANDNPVFYNIIPNNELPFFADVQVRRALYHALDKETIVGPRLWMKSADSWLPPNHPMYGGPITMYNYDLTLAANLLNAAGWVDSNGNGIRDKNGVEFEFDFYYYDYEGNEFYQQLAATFQADLAALGIDVHLIASPGGDIHENARRGLLDAYTIGWGFDDRYDPMGYDLFHSSQIPTAYTSYYGNIQNGRWRDVANDSYLLAARTELDATALRNLYAQQLARFTDQVPIWTYGHNQRFDAAVPTLQNFRPNPSTPLTWNMETWELPDNPYDLTVRKKLALNSPAPQPGATIEYEITVQNVGSLTTTNVALLDILADEFVYISATPTPDSITGQTLVWNLGDLPGNSPLQTVLVSVQIPATVPHGTDLNNSVQVYASEGDTRPGNNGFVHTITVRDDVDLAVTKYGVGETAVGEHYNYYIDYANWGGAPAANAVVTDILPPEVNFLSANPAPDSVVGDTLTWNLSTLAGNQWGGEIEITAEIINPGTVVNTADINFGGADVDPANNTDDHTENIDAILPPVILRPTQGTTDGTPTVSGLAPSSSSVVLYDIQNGSPVWLANTTATTSGTFSVELGLAEGTYVLVGTASKASLTSEYSNAATIVVDHDVSIDTDTVDVSAKGVNISSGSIRAEIQTLAHRVLDLSMMFSCSISPNAHLEVTENGLFTYDIPPVSTTNMGSNNWESAFRVWLAEPHSSYEIWLEWDCNGVVKRELIVYILIDPDGYLYDQSVVDADSAIEDALILNGVVTAYVKLKDTWQVWDANLYGQVNPQTTDGATDDGVIEAGYYSFLTPSGQYRIEARAPGYQPYQSPVLTVITTPVHLDIGLQPIMGGSGYAQAPVDLAQSSKTVDADSAWVGDTLTYNILLQNSGDINTGELRLEDLIPDNASYIPGSLNWNSGDADYDAATNIIWWEGNVLKNDTVSISYQVQVAITSGTPFNIESNNPTLTGTIADVYSFPSLTAVTTIQGYDLFLPVVLKP